MSRGTFSCFRSLWLILVSCLSVAIITGTYILQADNTAKYLYAVTTASQIQSQTDVYNYLPVVTESRPYLLQQHTHNELSSGSRHLLERNTTGDKNHSTPLDSPLATRLQPQPMSNLKVVTIQKSTETLSGSQTVQLGFSPLPLNQGDTCATAPIKSWKKGVITEFLPPIQRNCNLLRQGNQNEISRVRKALKTWRNSESDEEWKERMTNCSSVVDEFSNNFYVSREEAEFPLAYIFVVYTNARQVVRLMKAIYSPQNIYCIHPDEKQGEQFAQVFRDISRCLGNIFVASKLEKVYYQHHTIMDAQLNCMEDLLKYKQTKWKYVINLCGRELPLKTNRERVKSLKRLNGASAVDAVVVGSKAFLWKDRFTEKVALNYTTGKLYHTGQKVNRPPHRIKIYKSFNFIAITRPFVEFILHSKKATDFRHYLREVKIPEEHFYASLAVLPEAPGGNPRRRGISVPVIDQYIWLNSAGHPRKYRQHCAGRNVHFICILTVGDLPEIYRLGVHMPRPHFFFNKYFMEEDHVVMDCMEERLIQQNIQEYKHDCPQL